MVQDAGEFFGFFISFLHYDLHRRSHQRSEAKVPNRGRFLVLFNEVKLSVIVCGNWKTICPLSDGLEIVEGSEGC